MLWFLVKVIYITHLVNRGHFWGAEVVASINQGYFIAGNKIIVYRNFDRKTPYILPKICIILIVFYYDLLNLH